MTRLARGCFVITSCRLARRATTQRYCGYHAFEHNGAAGKGYGVAGFDPVRGFHTLAVEVDSAASDRISRGGTGLEQSDSEQPAVDPHGARPCLITCTHGRGSVIDDPPPEGCPREYSQSTADQYRVDRFGRKERGDRKCDRLVLTPSCRSRTAALGQANGSHVATPGYSGRFILRRKAAKRGSCVKFFVSGSACAGLMFQRSESFCR